MKIEDIQKCFQKIKDCNYSDLSELAELSSVESEELQNECELIDYALYKVLKHGSFKDIVDALKMYIKYILSLTVISLSK